jgi:hypothetical protein
MAQFTTELNTSFNFPNINIYNQYRDGVQYGYQVIPYDGYVMYDTNDYHTEINPDTMEEIPVTHYYTMAGLPLSYNFDNFSWVAVLRSEVNENYIFGGDNDHETI